MSAITEEDIEIFISNAKIISDVQEVVDWFNLHHGKLFLKVKTCEVFTSGVHSGFIMHYKDKTASWRELFKVKFRNELTVSLFTNKDTDDLNYCYWSIEHNLDDRADKAGKVSTIEVKNTLKRMLKKLLAYDPDDPNPLRNHEIEIY